MGDTVAGWKPSASPVAIPEGVKGGPVDQTERFRAPLVPEVKRGGKVPSMRALLIAAADEIDPRTGRPMREMIARRIVMKAANGDNTATKEFLERVDGKVPDRIAGPDGGAVQVDLLIAQVSRVYGETVATEIQASFTAGES